MIYVAGAYSNKDPQIQEQNLFHTKSVVAVLYNRHKKLYISPVLHWASVASEFELPHTMEYWQPYNDQLLQQCEALYIIQSQQLPYSEGTKHEFDLAHKMEKLIYVVCPITFTIKYFTGSWDDLCHVRIDQDQVHLHQVVDHL